MRASSGQQVGIPGNVSSWAWFATFAALVVLTRLWFLKLEQIDWDESTYLVRASNLWNPETGRLDIWYFRPPVFNGILYILTSLFGTTLVAVRGFGAACIFITACFSFKSLCRAYGARASGIAVGVVIAGIATPELQPTFTEHAVIAFLAIVLWLLVERPGQIWSAFLVGVCISLATLTRMNIAYVVLALGGYYLVSGLRRSGHEHRLAVFAYGLGGAMPLLALAAIYWLSGAIDRFLLFVFGTLLNYAFDQMPLQKVLGLQLANWARLVGQDPEIYGLLSLLLLGGIVVVIWRSLRHWRGNGTMAPPECRLVSMSMLLGCPVLLSILTGGAPYSHYWIQLFPFVAFLVAATLAVHTSDLVGTISRVAAILVIASPVLVYGVGAVQVVFHWSDLATSHFVRQVADRIAADRQPGDRIYALQYHLILWYLREPPLSPVVSHPSDIVQEPVMKPLVQAGLVHRDEFARILASRPRYMVKQRGVIDYLEDRPEKSLLEQTLATYYEPWITDGIIEVHRRR